MSLPFDCITDFIFIPENITAKTKADVIIVPGSHHPELAEKAAMLFHQKHAPYILISGGQNKFLNNYDSECAMLQEKCLQLDVPLQNLLCDHSAQNTFENAKNALQILQKHSIPHTKIILVLKGFHSRRALLTFQTIFPYPAFFNIATVNHNPRLQNNTWYLHEPCIKIVMSEVAKIGNYFSLEINNIHQKYQGELRIE